SPLNPELDDVGFVIAKRNFPLAAATAMSFQPTLFDPAQPSLVATLCFTPTTTGLSITGLCSRTLDEAPASATYLSDANHATSPALPDAIFSAPSRLPVYVGTTVTPASFRAASRMGTMSFSSLPAST